MLFQFLIQSFKHFLAYNLKSILLYQKSISGKKLTRQIGSQRFGFTAEIIVAKRSDVYGELMAFVIKQEGSKENFTIVPPGKSTRGTETGTVLVNGVHNVGDNTIAMDGFGGDGSGRFKAGDLIKFASHTKVYMIVEVQQVLVMHQQ